MKLTVVIVLSALLSGPAQALSPEAAPTAPPPAPSQAGPPSKGLMLAVGLGYGVGFGTLYSNPTYPSVLPTSGFDPGVRDTVSGQLPLSVSVGYRPIPLLSFGAALAYAPIFLKDAPDGGYGGDARVGVELRLHVIHAPAFSLWTSAGFGYESFSYSKNPNVDSSRDARASGYDFDLQVGGDFPLTGAWTLGPYVGLRMGTFRHFYTKCGAYGCAGSTTDVDIPDENRAPHEWLTVGVRGVFAVPAR